MQTTNKQQKQQLPNLRFAEFDGEWKKVSLAQAAKVITGSTPSTAVQEYYNGNELFVSPADIQGNRFVEQTKTTLTELGFGKGRKVLKGSVLFVCIGSTIGKVGQASTDCITSQQINALFANKGFDNNFIYEILEKNAKRIKLLAGVQAVPQINKTDFSSFKFPFPTLPEQQKIAAFLSAVDEKIQQLSSKKELLAQYKKGVMQKLFSQEIRFKADDGQDFPEWEEKRLGKVCVINPKSSSLPETFIYIDLESVEKGSLIAENRINISEAPSRAQRVLEVGDILFQMVRPYQKNNLLFIKKGEYVASTGYAQMRSKELPMFLYQLLHTDYFVRMVMEKCTGTSYPSINSSDLANIKVQIPCIEEQQKIASFLSQLDAKLESVNTQLTQMQSFKKGLLQQMFV